VIGEIFDRVYQEGGSRYNENVQTTLIPAGGSTICEFKLETSGDFILVDHSIFRAFNKGALGILDVPGDADLAIFSGQKSDTVYLPEGGAIQSIPSDTVVAPAAANKAERIVAGKAIYGANCAACHMPDGSGVPMAFPPLAAADYLNEDVDRAIDVVIHGLQGKIEVNGQPFESIMPTLGLNDEAVANVLTYVYSEWDNKGVEVTPEQVAKVRAAKK
jgi:nitrite reductase (NO-forming)